MNDRAIRHRCVFDGHKLIQRRVGNYEATDMLRQVPWKSDQLSHEIQESFNNRTIGSKTRLKNAAVIDLVPIPPLHRARQASDLQVTQAQHLANISQRTARTISNDRCCQCRTFTSILLIDVLDNLFTALMLEINIDVRWFVALFGDKPFNEHLHAIRINFSDTQAKTHG